MVVVSVKLLLIATVLLAIAVQDISTLEFHNLSDNYTSIVFWSIVPTSGGNMSIQYR